MGSHSKMRVMTVIGTRPEIIRLSSTIKKLDYYFDHILVHTGQNYDYELNQVFFEDLGLREPDEYLNSAGATAAETIGNVISFSDKVFEKYKPKALLLLGDTNSCMSVISAKRRKIPIFHMEAGNRCYDMRVPEEINRKIVDHTADVNLPYSALARDALIAEGLNPDLIITTGSPIFEVLNDHKAEIMSSNVLERLSISRANYFLVSAHREENIDIEKNFNKLRNVLNLLAQKYDKTVIVSTHPRTRKKLDAIGGEFDGRIQFHKPLGFFDYVCLQMNAATVLSDSGTISEEASLLKFPALNLRETHERHEAFEEGAVMMTGLDFSLIDNALQMLLNPVEGKQTDVSDYVAPNVSEKVARIILSYTPYVNRVVWREYG
jgi:UDP-N-acetylglucosamine 2-epimerase